MSNTTQSKPLTVTDLRILLESYEESGMGEWPIWISCPSEGLGADLVPEDVATCSSPTDEDYVEFLLR